jgi:hypothetical protein
LVGIVLLASGTLALPSANAAIDYNVKVMANATGDVEQLWFDPSQVTVTITNLPGGGKRAILSIIGGGGGGGLTQSVLVASNCVALVNIGGGTNAIAVDTNCLYAEGFALQGNLAALSNYLANTIAPTNGLATISFVNSLSNYLAVAQASLLADINSVTNGLATTGFVTGQGYVTQTITNGLATPAVTNGLAQPSVTNGLIASVVSGGNSGNGGVTVSGGTATITFPAGASVTGTNSVAGINGLVSNVTISVAGNLSVASTISASGGTITIAATAPLTNYDSVIFHNFAPSTTNDSIGFFYGNSYGTNGTGAVPNLDTSDGVTNRIYSTATCTSTNAQNGFAYAKLMAPAGQTNLIALGMHFKIDQTQNSNIVVQVSSALRGASVIFTAQVAAANTDTQTNFPTSGTFLTNNCAGQRIDLRWNVSMTTSNLNNTAQVGVGDDFKWIQQ